MYLSTVCVIKLVQNQIDSAENGEYATKFFMMLAKSMSAFNDNFEKYGDYCKPASLVIPCEMFRYGDDTTIHEVVGTLRTIVNNVIDECVEGFGWQWASTVEGLVAVIPDVVIPNVSGIVLFKKQIHDFSTFL